MQWYTERVILAVVYTIGILGVLLIPSGKRRLAHTAFLFQGMVSWILGIIVVEAGWLQYPVREMSNSSGTSFLFEFLMFPVIAAYYNMYYPEGKALRVQAAWLLLFSGSITALELLIEKNTLLILYTGWQWYWTTISVSTTLLLSRYFCRWFFREWI